MQLVDPVTLRLLLSAELDVIIHPCLPVWEYGNIQYGRYTRSGRLVHSQLLFWELTVFTVWSNSKYSEK